MEAIQAVSLWSALNLAVMLILALNVSRLRFQYPTATDKKAHEERLTHAVRAHGNNIEYVPSMLLGMLLLAFLGEQLMVLHLSGALLLLARILHAYGIQDRSVALPKTRVLGNLITWLIFAVLAVRILMLALL